MESLLPDDVQNMACPTGRYLRLGTSKESVFWSNPDNIAMFAENSNYKHSLYRLVACISENSNTLLYNANRSQYRIYNILDLNIVPINVHALQREIPFSNLLNYAFTFDNMVKESIGIQYKHVPLNAIKGVAPAVNNVADTKWVSHLMEFDYSDNEFKQLTYTEDALVRHLIYPNGFRRFREYANHVRLIMAGNTGLTLNKPKFLSDQLWNKVLLNILYASTGINTELPVSSKSRSLQSNAFAAARIMNGTGDLNADSKEPVLVNFLDYKCNFPYSTAATDGTYQYMTYVDDSGNVKKSRARAADLTPGNITDEQKYIEYTGYMRYNTKLIRWVEWTVNCQRIVRLLLRDTLSRVEDAVVNNLDAVDENVTEYRSDNGVFNINDFY